ncbi:MAG TPA: hypothetical protein VFQ44_06620 [Streptosporangiaceae bacterium]|nr:hypothetical protein [Streptosporangiaceae bacterium]
MTHDHTDPVKLSDHICALNSAAGTGAVIPVGRLYGLPELPGGHCWVDMAGVAALTGVPPNTITSWLARGGPVRNPFPTPARILYRLYWPWPDIESWRSREPWTDSAHRAVPFTKS